MTTLNDLVVDFLPNRNQLAGEGADTVEAVVTFSGPTLYTVAGEAFVPADIGLATIVSFKSDHTDAGDSSGDYTHVKYDSTNDKMLFFGVTAATGADVEEGAADLSAQTYAVRVVGTPTDFNAA